MSDFRFCAVVKGKGRTSLCGWPLTRLVFAGSLLLVAPLAGCEKATPASIETWKGTVKGPGKLEDAVKNGGLDPTLRAQAAVALEEIGKGDRVAAAMADMNDGARGPLVSALIALHSQRLDGEKSAEARDSLVSLRGFASETERTQIDVLLLEAIKTQLGATGRLTGSQSLARIVEDIGAPAAPVLADLLAEPKVNHLEIANLLDRIADAPVRDRAGAQLVSVLPKLPAVAAPHFEALGRLGGKPAVDYLVKTLASGRTEDAAAAARALQLQPHPELGDMAVKMAADAGTPGVIRDEMFGLAETCCGDKTRAGLIGIITSSKAEKGQDAERAELVRYRAYEAALAVGGAPAIRPALEAFPARGKYKRQDVEDFLVKDIAKLAARKGGKDDAQAGKEAVRTALADTLASPAVLARMTAVLALEQLGEAAQSAALAKLKGDKSKLDGFGSTSVGAEAARVATKLSKAR